MVNIWQQQKIQAKSTLKCVKRSHRCQTGMSNPIKHLNRKQEIQFFPG